MKSIFLLLFFLVSLPQAFANVRQNTSPETSADSVSTQSEIPAGLDFKKRAAKRRFLEIEPFIGEYLGNYLDNSLVTGGRVAFRITDAITVGAEFNYNRIRFDANSNFGLSVTNRNQYIADAFFTYAFPILQRTGKTIQEADLFTTVGIGNMNINEKNRLVGLIGGGVKFFTKIPWLGFRFDVNTYMYSLPRSTDSKFADDWTFTAGPSFLFFPKK